MTAAQMLVLRRVRAFGGYVPSALVGGTVNIPVAMECVAEGWLSTPDPIGAGPRGLMLTNLGADALAAYERGATA